MPAVVPGVPLDEDAELAAQFPGLGGEKDGGKNKKTKKRRKKGGAAAKEEL